MRITLCDATALRRAARSSLFWLVVSVGVSAALPSASRGAIAQKLATGVTHTCALTDGGGVKCWGIGALGDGWSFHPVPSDATGLTSGVTAIAAGDFFTCALTITGGAKCWGDNHFGQLGDGTTTDHFTAQDVSGLTSGVVAIAASGAHACALTSAGGVKCWGGNASGELGDGTTTNSLTPVAVSGLPTGVAAIAAGAVHTCAVTTGGGAKCWGGNSLGALGNGTTTSSSVPVDVSGLTSGVAAISASNLHTCALTVGGGVKCWGGNYLAGLGDGTFLDRLTPVDVLGLTSGATAIAAGYAQSCALLSSGAVKCWGWNQFGGVGDGTTLHRPAPVDVSSLTTGAVAISAALYHACAVTDVGGVKCWGDNYYAQLGIDEYGAPMEAQSIPVDVSGLGGGVAAIDGGAVHACALTNVGGVKCWGANDIGALGDGTTLTRLTPADVSGFAGDAMALSTGIFHTCAVTTGGGAKCWGSNYASQLGDGTTTDRATPVDVSGLTSGVADISAGYHLLTCALTSLGGVKCWGQNDYGIGDGTPGSPVPVDVSGLASGLADVAVGAEHACALTSGGGVKCWGRNSFGQVGDGTTTDRPTPVDVTGLTSGVSAITTGAHHSCALLNGGGARCWGSNGVGQLGDGTTTDRSTAIDVSGLTSGIATISAGGAHTCALMNDGGVKCWGHNESGQIGDATSLDRLTAVDVGGLTSGVAAIGAGWVTTCAVMSAGGAKCWGANSDGQLGDGRAVHYNVPQDVIGFGLCGNGAIDAGETCDDGNTVGDDCCSPRCVIAMAGDSCSDGNPCTDDQCDGAGVCAHTNNTAPCDDDAFCNGTDTCAGGSCAQHTGDPCAGGSECADACNEAADGCFDVAGTSCASDGNSCTDDQCNGGGACTHPNNTSTCDDGIFCNGADACNAGSCQHSGDPCSGGGDCADLCNEAGDTCFELAGAACDTDGDLCTDDHCDGAGLCAHPFNAAPCDDGDTCSVSDVCSAGTCAGSFVDADADGVFQGCDNCPAVANADQRNVDGEGGGDLCDPCPADASNTCDTMGSAAATIGAAGTGGSPLTTPDGSVTISVPPGTLAADTSVSITGGVSGATYGLATSQSVLVAELQPEGIVFDPPAIVTFTWPDVDDDGKVDGTGVAEQNLKLYRNGVLLFGAAQSCQDFTGANCTPASCCNRATNTWTVQRSTFSEYGLARECTSITLAQLKLTKLDTPPGDDGLSLKGTFGLAPGVSIADLDLLTHGLTLVLDDAGGTAIRAVLAAGPFDGLQGWRTNGSGTQLTYKNKTATPPAGVTKAVIKTAGAKAPDRIKIQVTGKDGDYDVTTPIVPILEFPATGECASARFAGPAPLPACSLNRSGSTLQCR